MAEQNNKEVAVTYEKLYELLRREKSREELQELSSGFFQDVLVYLKEKHKILDETAGKKDVFSFDEHEKTQLQLVNIRKIIRELYERREKKIIEMAVNKSRTKTNLIDTRNLLGQEKYLFESVVSVLDSFRDSVVQKVLNLQEPKEVVEGIRKEQGKEEPEIKEEAKEKIKDATKEKENIQENKLTKLRFTRNVEQFVGEELELYGPFQQDESAELPSGIAKILIDKGSAVGE